MEQENLTEGIYFKSEIKDSTLIIYAQGELVYQTIPTAKDKFNLIFSTHEHYVLDLSQITRIDSTGFGFILNVIKKLPDPTQIVAVIVDEFIKELFNITKINQLIDLYPSISEALDKFSK